MCWKNIMTRKKQSKILIKNEYVDPTKRCLCQKKFTNNNIKWIYIVLNAQSLQTTITILK